MDNYKYKYLKYKLKYKKVNNLIRGGKKHSQWDRPLPLPSNWVESITNEGHLKKGGQNPNLSKKNFRHLLNPIIEDFVGDDFYSLSERMKPHNTGFNPSQNARRVNTWFLNLDKFSNKDYTYPEELLRTLTRWLKVGADTMKDRTWIDTYNPRTRETRYIDFLNKEKDFYDTNFKMKQGTETCEWVKEFSLRNSVNFCNIIINFSLDFYNEEVILFFMNLIQFYIYLIGYRCSDSLYTFYDNLCNLINNTIQIPNYINIRCREKELHECGRTVLIHDKMKDGNVITIYNNAESTMDSDLEFASGIIEESTSDGESTSDEESTSEN